MLCIVIADIDECAIANGGCEHNCINTQGSFYCGCHEGFVLGSDGHQIDVEVILVSVDSVCMDSSNMQYMRIQKIPQILKISELISLY